MKLTVLGTGNAMVTRCYNTCFVISEDKRHFLVDGGGGNALLRKLEDAGINWMDIRDIFVTHKHVDHLLGIIWMMRIICQNMSTGKYQGEARIYGHDEVIELLTDIAGRLLQPKQTQFIGNRLKMIAVSDSECREILDRKVCFFDIGSTKAKQFGFAMEIAENEKLCCCGDEPFNECERDYAQNSKWLLHEAFCLYSQADEFKPYEKHHSTAKDACELAESLGAENLILYHTEEKNLQNRRELYTAEGKEYYSGNLFVPYDMEVIEL